MSQSNSSTDHFGWSVYKLSPPDMQNAFLEELKLDTNLPLVTWRGQVGMLDGAPDDILIKYLPQLYWAAQVEIFNKHLSVGAMPEAVPLLKVEAKKKLGIIEPKIKQQVRRWSYKNRST